MLVSMRDFLLECLANLYWPFWSTTIAFVVLPGLFVLIAGILDTEAGFRKRSRRVAAGTGLISSGTWLFFRIILAP